MDKLYRSLDVKWKPVTNLEDKKKFFGTVTLKDPRQMPNKNTSIAINRMNHSLVHQNKQKSLITTDPTKIYDMDSVTSVENTYIPIIYTYIPTIYTNIPTIYTYIPIIYTYIPTIYT